MKPFNHEEGIAFLRDKFVPFGEAQLHVASSPVLYGLAVYTVFGLNWNGAKKKLYAFRLKDHYARLVNSAKIMGFDSFAKKWPYEKFEKTMIELARKNAIKENALVRVSVFIDALIAGTKIRGLPVELSAYVYPLGQILPKSGINVCVSSWQRTPDNSIPSRAKVNGGYVNACLMKNEALLNGYDDAVALDHNGHVTEGTVANIFIVRNGRLITPGSSSDILEGITRDSILRIARDMKIPVEERPVDRTELYVAEEIFVCGSSAGIVPVLSVDKRLLKKSPENPLIPRLSEAYQAAQIGADDAYKEWRMEVK